MVEASKAFRVFKGQSSYGTLIASGELHKIALGF